MTVSLFGRDAIFLRVRSTIAYQALPRRPKRTLPVGQNTLHPVNPTPQKYSTLPKFGNIELRHPAEGRPDFVELAHRSGREEAWRCALEPFLQAQVVQLLVRIHLLFALDCFVLDCFFGTGPAAASRASRSAFSRSRF